MKSLAKSLAISALVLGPGIYLLDDQPVIAGLWMLVGSFGLMSWTYRKPWRLMWVTILLPPLASAAAYGVQLAFLPGEPQMVVLLGALAAGLVIGFLRGRAHRVYIKGNAVFAQRTVAYLGLWLICYGVSQGFAYANMHQAADIGRAGGAFSTAMLAMVCLAILTRFLRERKRLARQTVAGAALLVFLFFTFFSPSAWLAQPASAQVIANECRVILYPQGDNPNSPAAFLQQTKMQPNGDLFYLVHVIQNPTSARGKSIIAGLGLDVDEMVRQWGNNHRWESYASLVNKAESFCRTKALVCLISRDGGSSFTRITNNLNVPPPPPGPPVHGGSSTGTGVRTPPPPPPPPPRGRAKDVAETAAVASAILIIAGIGANLAAGLASALGGAVQAAAQAAAEAGAEAAAQAMGESPAAQAPEGRPAEPSPPEPPPPKASRRPAAPPGDSDPQAEPPKVPQPGDQSQPGPKVGLTGTMGDRISDPGSDLGGVAAEQAVSISDFLSNPNNWVPFSRAMSDLQKGMEKISTMVGEAGWDNTGLGWGINLVTGTVGGAAGELADLPRQAVSAAGAVWDVVSDKENWTVIYETGRDSLLDLGGFLVGHKATQEKIAATMKSGIETAGSIAGTLSVAVEQDPAGAAVAGIKMILGGDNWAKVIDGDVPLLERMGRAIWGGVDTGGTLWGVGSLAKGAAGKVSTLVRGADMTGDLAAGARVMDKAGEAASASRGLGVIGELDEGAKAGRGADALGDAGAAARAGESAGAVEGGADLGRTAEKAAEAGRAEAAGVRRGAAAGHEDDAGLLAKYGDEAGDGPDLPPRREPVDPELVRQRRAEVRDTLRKEGVRDDLVERMDYDPHAKDMGAVRGTRTERATGAVHREGFETLDEHGNIVARSETSKESTALHEVEHIQQHDQMRTQAARGGPKESFYDPDTGKLTQEGNIQMEIEVRMNELDRNLALREDAIRRHPDALPHDPNTWPQEALDAQEEIDLARNYLDRTLPDRVPDPPPRVGLGPDDVTDPNIDLAGLQNRAGPGTQPMPGQPQTLDIPSDGQVDEILGDMGMTRGADHPAPVGLGPEDVTDPNLDLDALRGRSGGQPAAPDGTPSLEFADEAEIDDLYRQLGMTRKPPQD